MKIKNIFSALLLTALLGMNAAYSAAPSKTAQTQPAVRTQKIPAGVIEASKKFGLWSDIYTSPKKVVVYSYIPGSKCPYQSQAFHNKIVSAAGSSGGKYMARGTTPQKMQKELDTAGAKLDAKRKVLMPKNNPEDAKAFNKDVQAFNNLVRFTNQCTLRACIINPSKGEYIMMNRQSEEAVKTMSKYK